MKIKQILGLSVAVSALTLSATSLYAAEKLNVICSANIDWCQLMVTDFEKETGVSVKMARKSSGETLAQIRAEKRNPKVDIWWGGTGDPHLQAAEEGLSYEYKSENLGQLQDWAVRQAEQSGYKTVGIYAGGLGFGYNVDILKKKGLPEPKSWMDLTKPIYKGEVQMANPNSSGTAYTTLATIVQVFGEEEGFEYMKKLHKNINQYTKSGSAPVKAAARGENTIGIVFMHDAVKQTVKGFPIGTASPSEGTGYEVGSMSIIKGARNLDNAKKWYEFALRADIQTRAATVKAYQVPSNKTATAPKEAPRLEDIKLIDYDFKTYGSSKTRKRLLAKWDKEVKVLPR
ncbi:MAG: ABC transporter substrate-binding protein [Oceanospirillaceae bacterium]|jgi:iron(III) transport system substrate-binding protein